MASVDIPYDYENDIVYFTNSILRIIKNPYPFPLFPKMEPKYEKIAYYGAVSGVVLVGGIRAVRFRQTAALTWITLACAWMPMPQSLYPFPFLQHWCKQKEKVHERTD